MSAAGLWSYGNIVKYPALHAKAAARAVHRQTRRPPGRRVRWNGDAATHCAQGGRDAL